LNQICDTSYGNIKTASGFSPACSTLGVIGSPDTTSCVLPQTLAPKGTSGDSYTCTFDVTQGEIKTVKDTITANGLGSDSKTPFSNTSNEVTVTSTDAPSTSTTTKGYTATNSACFTVRYSADVKNTSGADETLTLSALSDSQFGDITSTHGTGNNAVLGTTCGVATGVGTLSGSAGAGSLQSGTTQTIAPGSTYSCKFDGQFCGNLGPIASPACANGLQHQNTVTPTLVGDEGETVSNTGGSLTVTQCLSTTAQ